MFRVFRRSLPPLRALPFLLLALPAPVSAGGLLIPPGVLAAADPVAAARLTGFCRPAPSAGPAGSSSPAPDVRRDARACFAAAGGRVRGCFRALLLLQALAILTALSFVVTPGRPTG